MGLFGCTKIKVKLIHKDAKLPSRAYQEAACWDLYACEDVILGPWKGARINVGLAMEIPKGWMARIYTRSSHGFKGLRVHLGIIDSDYRGPISPFIINQNPGMVTFRKGERIGQIHFARVPRVKMEAVDKLGTSVRGERGFGSSGK